MAQSMEARLVKQVSDSLARVDFNVYQFAQGTTSYPPLIKIRLAEVVAAIAQMHAIDYEYGNFHPDEHEAMKFFAGLRKYVTGLDTPPDFLVR